MNTNLQTKKIDWIEGTPFGISIYSARSLSTQLHENVIEFIMCVKGNIRFSYSYEEFTLHEGEFISVDRDAYYLVDGKDSVCVSFFINMPPFHDKYPMTKNYMFVCEALEETTTAYPTAAHLEVQSLLIGLLDYLGGFEDFRSASVEIINNAADKIVKMMVENFDIVYFWVPGKKFSNSYLARYRAMITYMWDHVDEPLTLSDMAEHFHLTESYISEFIRKSGISFKKIISYNRANYSEKLLLTTNDSIAAIADKCGFSDAKLYYSAFRMWYKCTPRQFREKYKFEIKDDIEYLELENISEEIRDIAVKIHNRKLFLKK
ncbi:AraC family transcriptional regulator [Anaerovorax odorimutans]|uniref:AraC family transcriptional regulator n=1 Tax=Anaerovorax odorimutans TaxID=109327 RepID=A0ABT1RPX0_9FIRM|nr:AraC family transcriptional regulator [Anaerovorax odorimutans]MCQ4637225.1 AraC family transcriptional regulator [Anaerovorax odorimutans]